MSSDEKKKDGDGDAKKADSAGPAAVLKKPSAIGGILRIMIPALLAAGASYGGTRYAKAQNAIIVIHDKEEAEGGGKHHEAHPPGPTLSLEPFLLSVFDTNKKPHPMKLTVAVEFDAKAAGGHDADPKIFMPRIRDVVLTHLRGMTYEDVADPAHFDKIRKELLEQCKEVGAESATMVLVTDFVIQ
jgi:flagellar basal body-associated protein FliL